MYLPARDEYERAPDALSRPYQAAAAVRLHDKTLGIPVPHEASVVSHRIFLGERRLLVARRKVHPAAGC
jgi:hypothetical protein